MKLIDEKGRLFGKVNLIDLLVVLLIVAVLAAVVWKLGGKKAAAAVTGADKKAVYIVYRQRLQGRAAGGSGRV